MSSSTPRTNSNHHAAAAPDNTDAVSVVSDSSTTNSSSSTKPTTSSSMTTLREPTWLPVDFTPSDHDVVMGRGKHARTAPGNQRLRMLIELMIPEYQAAAHNKDEKSYIIREIVTQIRKSCGSQGGGFCKWDKTRNRWHEVGDFLAREKISQTFRDCMGADAYSSSNPFKKRKRRSNKLEGGGSNNKVEVDESRSARSMSNIGTKKARTSDDTATTASMNSLDSSTHSTGSCTHTTSGYSRFMPQSPPTTGPRPVLMMSSPGILSPMHHHHPVVSPHRMPKRPGELGFARRLFLESQQAQVHGGGGGRSMPMPRPMLLAPANRNGAMPMAQQQRRHHMMVMMQQQQQRRRQQHVAMMNMSRMPQSGGGGTPRQLPMAPRL